VIARRAALLVYAIAVRAFPRADRTLYAEEMLDAFAHELDSRRAQGLGVAIRFVIAAWVDAVRAGLGERQRMRVGISWLDVRLGVRMLLRYPGLSLAGGLGIVLIILCATLAGLFHAVIGGTLPFADGSRIVAIENWDAKANRPAPHDFETWRTNLTTIEDVGAYRLVTRNLAAGEGAPEPVRVAEISAAAFTIAGVPPQLGRYLVEADEREGAAAVVVIRADEWERRFAADPQIVGRAVVMGGTPATIVGVMPRQFGFPVNERYWTAGRFAASDFGWRQAPSSMPYKTMTDRVVNVFGRLARGVDLAAAQAELNVVGARLGTASSAHDAVRPRVMGYTYWFFREQHDGELFLVWGLLALLLGIVGANVAVLVYARTATRRVEIALRSAIGASRGRIVGQMFVEGLVLSLAAAAAGVLIAVVVQRELAGIVLWEQMPFWVNTSVTSPVVLLYVVVVSIGAAAVVGAVPALQATGWRAQNGLQQAAMVSSGWKIGRTYGALIVVQVALAVAILPYALSTAWTSIRSARIDPAIQAGAFLTARIDLEGASASALASRKAALLRRLSSDAGVARALFLAGTPGSEPAIDVDLDGLGAATIGAGDVGIDFIDAFGIRVLAGRAFDARDVAGPARHAIVNRTFAEQITHGDPLGRRVREAAAADGTPGPWLDIVGVIEDFPAPVKHTRAEARLYRPVAYRDPRLSLLTVRSRGDAATALATGVRAAAAEVDRDLLVRDVRTLDQRLRDEQIGARIGAWAAGLATASLLLLSATGLYALMAFTVAQRRREIGIRIALGALPRAVVRGILSRALRQLATGVTIGVAVAAAFNDATASEFTGGAGLEILPIVAALVLAIGLAAAAVPARRALGIEPTEALKAQ